MTVKRYVVRILGALTGLSLLATVGLGSSAQATDRLNFKTTGIENGKLTFFTRYRYENVDQAGFADDARASTWLFRPGFVSGYFYGFRVGAEADLIAEVGDDDFNNTINGNAQFPVVVDVESAEVNLAYLESHHIPGVLLTGGRFRKNLDNMRYLGSVGWRQNDQTFDGASAEITSIPGFNFYYAYIGNVNRIFSDDGPDGFGNDGNLTSNIHIVNAKYKDLPLNLGTLTGYAYLMDIMDVDALSNASYGGHLKGKQKVAPGVSFNYYFEYARQTDYGDSPFDYSADYVRVQPGVTIATGIGPLTTSFVYELLGSDNGVRAFQTPLATGHVFNGFADVFLATPNEGLEDIFVDVTLKLKGLPPSLAFFNGLLLKAQYHEFDSDVGSADFGNEFDFYAKMPLKISPRLKGLYGEFKYANFDGEGSRFADREKFIFGVGYKY